MQRGVAYFADAFLVLMLWLLPLVVASFTAGYEPSDFVLLLTWFPIHAAYYIFPTAVALGTPGKTALRMRIVKRNGEAPTPDVVILRYLVFLITFLVPLGLLASLALVLTDPERRALHDRIAGTIVVSE
jgi:uncharacterized RDD family membrane protein YckC